MTNVKVIDTATWDGLPTLDLSEGQDMATVGLATGQYRTVRADFAGVSLTQWVGAGVESAGEVGAPSTEVAPISATGVESSGEVGAPAVTEVAPISATGVESSGEVGAPAVTLPSSGTPAIVSAAVTDISGVVLSRDVALPSSMTVGNTLVVIIGTGSADGIDTPVDSNADAYTLIGRQSWSTFASIDIFQIAIDADNVSDTTVTIDVTSGGGFKPIMGIAIEVSDTSGINTGNLATGTGSGGQNHVGLSITTTEANALVLECTAMRNSAGPATGPSSGYEAHDTNIALVVGTQTPAAAGATTGVAFTTVDNETAYAQFTVELVA